MTTRKEINNARNEAIAAMVEKVTGPAKLALEASENKFEEVSSRYPGTGNEGHEEWLVEAKAARQEMKAARDAESEAESEMVRQDAVIRAQYRAMIVELKNK